MVGDVSSSHEISLYVFLSTPNYHELPLQDPVLVIVEMLLAILV
jgi:hypothetical protein